MSERPAPERGAESLQTRTFDDDGAIPNSPLPVILYRGALESDAGTGHCNAGSSPDLLVVGAYPDGRSWDVRRGDPGEHDEVLANIASVPVPDRDPVRGDGGPLTDFWRSDPQR